MLVPPAIRTRRPSPRRWLKIADDYTLWAFNAPRLPRR